MSNGHLLHRCDAAGERSRRIDWSAQSDNRQSRRSPKRPVAAGKGSAAYNAHSYPTKVPPEAIVPYIERFSSLGDVVLDPFCGSGMTGLAAIRCGRRAILNDLSPLAVHLAFNHTRACDPTALKRAWTTLHTALRGEEQRHYAIRCTECRGNGTIRYTIWSDVYRCPGCRSHVTLWDSTDRREGKVPKQIQCPSCGETWPKSAGSRVRVDPVWVAYSCECRGGLHQRALTKAERRRAARFPSPSATEFVPKTVIDSKREMYQRSALHLRGVRTVADLYTTRNLSALTLLWAAIGKVEDKRIRTALAFAFTNTAWHGTRMRRFNARGGHRPLTGTLYIPQLSAEANVFDVFDHKIRQLSRFFADLERELTRLPEKHDPAVRLGSAADLQWIPTASVDYIFTDPPFGSNIFYADCNIVGEAWLGTIADEELEAVVNRSRRVSQGGKTLHDYELLLSAAFSEMHRVLKPGRRATVVFQSSDGAVWNAIERAAHGAGFDLKSVDILDKVQQSMKGYKGRSGAENVTSFDIVLQLERSVASTRTRRSTTESQHALLLRTIARHLARQPEGSEEERTLPFLYSLSIQALLNAGSDLATFSMDRLRDLLEPSFEHRCGRWYSPDKMAAVG